MACYVLCCDGTNFCGPVGGIGVGRPQPAALAIPNLLLTPPFKCCLPALVGPSLWVAAYTSSAGIAANKLLAKLGSALNKPNLQTVIPPRSALMVMQVCTPNTPETTLH